MKSKNGLKIAVDAMMTIALLVLMGYQMWGETLHEWVGTGMFILFILHHVLNRSWHKNLLKGRYTPVRILLTITDLLVFAAMLAQIYSGILMSRHVFAFLPFRTGMALARRLHILGSYWGFVLMSFHIGLHWKMLIGKLPFKAPRIHSMTAFVIGLVIAVYGAYVFLERDIPTYLFLRTEFVFLDYGESIFRFYIDHICLMGLWVFLAHYTAVLLKRLNKSQTKKKG